MDALDADMKADLLAVTGNAGSDLDGEPDIEEEDDGVLEEEEEEDDDDDDDGENDEEEYGIGDDDYEDDDYNKKKKKAKSKRASTGRNSKNAKKGKKKSSPSSTMNMHTSNNNSNNHKLNDDDDEDDEDEEEFQYEYDEDGYGDANDVEMLSKMTEVDREKVLTERQEKRGNAELMWKEKQKLKAKAKVKNKGLKARKSKHNDINRHKKTSKRSSRLDDDDMSMDDDMKLGDDDDDMRIQDDDDIDDDDDDDDRRYRSGSRSSGRNRSSSKSDALDALAQDKRKKTSRPNLEMSSDDESDIEHLNRGNDRSSSKRRKRDKHKDDDDYDEQNLDASDDEDEDDGEMDTDNDRKSSRRRRNKTEDIKDEKDIDKHIKKDSATAKEEGEEIEEAELCYKDIVSKTATDQAITSALFLRRDFIIQLSQQAYFGRVIKGLFVRLKVSDDLPHSSANNNNNSNNYLMCRIVGTHQGKVYELMHSNGLKTNQYLILQSGKQKKMFQINLMSGSHPTEHEFNVYIERAKYNDIHVPNREEIIELLKTTKKNLYDRNIIANEEEAKKHMTNMETVYPSRVNWTKKRTELETELDIKKQDLRNLERSMNHNHDHQHDQDHDIYKLEDEIIKIKDKIETYKKMEIKYQFQDKKTSNAQVFQSLAQRNQKLNATNESLAAIGRNFESNRTSIDLYSRFDATGQSYFSIGKDDGKNSGPLSEQAKDIQVGKVYDWRKTLSCWDINDTKKRKISDHPINQRYGIELIGLDDFVINYDVKLESRRAVSHIPPAIDAIYEHSAHQHNQHSSSFDLPPKHAKIITFEEWSEQRGG